MANLHGHRIQASHQLQCIRIQPEFRHASAQHSSSVKI